MRGRRAKLPDVVRVALVSLVVPVARAAAGGAAADAPVLWHLPKLRDLTIGKFNALLEAKVLPQLNRELPEAMREAGQDPMPTIGSEYAALVIRNVRGLSSIRFTSLEAKSLWPFKAEMEMGAIMAHDLTAEGEVTPPESLSQLIHSLAQKAGAGEAALPAAKSLPFTIRFTGVHMPHGVAYVLSNNMTALSGIEVEETPVVYEELSVECHPGFLGTTYSPARAMCTRAASKMARLKKEYIQLRLSEAVREVVQAKLDEFLPDRLPRDRYDSLASLACSAFGAALVLCGLAPCCLWCRRRRSLGQPLSGRPEARLLKSPSKGASAQSPSKGASAQAPSIGEFDLEGPAE